MSDQREILKTHEDSDLNAKQAADLLNVTMESFEKLLDNGAIPFQMVDGERFIRLDAFMEFKRRNEESRAKILDLTAEAQWMGLYE